MSEERRNEIAWRFLKRLVRENGIILSTRAEREERAEEIGVPIEEYEKFGKSLAEEALK